MGSVTVLLGTDYHPLQKIGKMAGICWGSPIDKEEQNIKRAIDCIKSGHGRVLEFVDIELCIEGYSARAIREWYTHIGGSPTRLQESTRYVDCSNFNYSTPTYLNDEQKVAYDNCMKSIQENYKNLLNLGIKQEDAAMILPLGMGTKIVDKRNLRNFADMCKQRLCSRAYWEYRNLMNDIIKQLSERSDEWKIIANLLFKPKCELAGYCTEKKCCGRKPRKEI